MSKALESLKEWKEKELEKYNIIFNTQEKYPEQIDYKKTGKKIKETQQTINFIDRLIKLKEESEMYKRINHA